MRITMTKEALMNHLAGRLKAAQAEDARLKKSHGVDEQAALQKFRAALRDALKWDYAEVKKHGFGVTGRYSMEPSCPKANSPAIERAIACVKLDGRKAPYSIGKGDDLWDAVHWLPESERPKNSICD